MSNLTNAEIEWLARHMVAHDEFLLEPSDQPLPEALVEKLHKFFTRSDGSLYYEIAGEWSSAENHAAIRTFWDTL